MSWTMSEPPGLDCLVNLHILVEHSEPGAWPTENGQVSWASWCLWCGSGVSNDAGPDVLTEAGD